MEHDCVYDSISNLREHRKHEKIKSDLLNGFCHRTIYLGSFGKENQVFFFCDRFIIPTFLTLIIP